MKYMEKKRREKRKKGKKEEKRRGNRKFGHRWQGYFLGHPSSTFLSANPRDVVRGARVPGPDFHKNKTPPRSPPKRGCYRAKIISCVQNFDRSCQHLPGVAPWARWFISTCCSLEASDGALNPVIFCLLRASGAFLCPLGRTVEVRIKVRVGV